MVSTDVTTGEVGAGCIKAPFPAAVTCRQRLPGGSNLVNNYYNITNLLHCFLKSVTAFTLPKLTFLIVDNFAVSGISSFRKWEEMGLSQFPMLGAGRQMYSQIHILKIIGDTVNNGFQYNQVKTLIGRMMKEKIYSGH